MRIAFLSAASKQSIAANAINAVRTSVATSAGDFDRRVACMRFAPGKGQVAPGLLTRLYHYIGATGVIWAIEYLVRTGLRAHEPSPLILSSRLARGNLQS